MATRINIEIDESDVRALVVEHLSGLMGTTLSAEDVIIEVKSKQNYKSEWERAAFRAVVNKVRA